MTDPADLIMRAAVEGGREAVVTLDQIDAAAKRAEKGADGLGAGTSRLSKQLQQADAALKAHQKAIQATTVHFDTLYEASQRDFHGAWVRGASQFVDASNKTGRGAKLASHEVMNLGRQFADLGTMAAMGASPLMVLVSQGPQIADVFATARARGVGFKDALAQIAVSARSLIAAHGLLIASLGGVAAAVFAAADGYRQMKSAMDAAEDSNRGFVNAMAMAEEAINGVAIATWKLADARKEAARQELNQEFKDNQDRLKELEDFGFFGGVGRAAGTIVGVYRGDEVAAEAARIRARQAEILGAGIRLITDTARDAEGAYEALVPRMKQIEEIERHRTVLQETLRAGSEALTKAGLTEAQAREAIAEADKKIADLRLSPEQKRAMEEAKRLAEAEQKRREATVKAADEGILRLRDEIEEIGRAEQEVRKLQIARQIAEAPLQRQKEMIRLLGEEREAAIRLTKAWEQLDALYKQNADRTMTDLQKVQRDNQKLLNDAADPRYPEAVSALGEATKLATENAEQWAKAQKAANDNLSVMPEHLNEGAKGIDTLADRLRDLEQAFFDVTFSAKDLFSSLKRGDLGGFLLNIQGMMSGIGSLLKQGPAGILSLGSVAANAIGGKTGRAIGGGLGIAGGGFALAGALPGIAGGLFTSGLLSGPMAAALAKFAPMLGPIGLAAGALYAAAKLLNVGGKPSNKGAGFDLVTGAISGKSRDQETEEAARSAGEAIRGIQDALKAAGIGLTDAVTGLVIGTRDQTQIYLQSGKTLRSAVGDSGAAVDTAMRALLEGATYVSDAQKKLVESAVAAGKGFDGVAEVLAKWESAQGISKSLADEILRLTDPKAYDLKAVEDAIAAQRKAAAELQVQGYLTAEQLAGINDQLTTLQGLQLAEVTKRYTEALNDNTEASRAAAEEAERQTRIAQGRNALTLEIMRLNGEAEEALRIERELQLAAIDPELRELQKLLWARQDEAAIIAQNTARLEDQKRAAEALAKTNDDLWLSILDMADPAAARAERRAREWKDATDPGTKALLEVRWAFEDLAEITEKNREAAEAAAEFQRTQEGLTVQLLRAQGLEQEALNIERAREVAETDARLRGLVAARHAAEDVRKAEEALAQERELAAARADRIADLNARLAELSGNGGLAMAIRRARELRDASSAAERALLQQIYAQENLNAANEARTQQIDALKDQLTDAYERERDLYQTRIDTYREYERNLMGFVNGLGTSEFALLTGEQRYNATRSAFLTGAGDPAEAQRLAEEFLNASKDYYAGTEAYFKDLALVKERVGLTAQWSGRIADKAEQQLGVLQTQVSELVALNQNVIGVQQAIATLRSAMGGGQYARSSGYVRAFADGGHHPGGLRLVGERGPELEVTGPARIFSAEQTRGMLSGGDNSDVVAELRALRQDVANLRKDVRAGNIQRGVAAEATLDGLSQVADRIERQTRAKRNEAA